MPKLLTIYDINPLLYHRLYICLICQIKLLLLIEKIENIMKRTPQIHDDLKIILKQFGTNIKLARKRRSLTTTQVAERADIARSTLWLIENGNKSVTIGSYIQVLLILDIEQDLLEVGKVDEFGRTLQDIKLLKRKKNN